MEQERHGWQRGWSDNCRCAFTRRQLSSSTGCIIRNVCLRLLILSARNGRQDANRQKAHQGLQVRAFATHPFLNSRAHLFFFQAPSIRSLPWCEGGMEEAQGYR